MNTRGCVVVTPPSPPLFPILINFFALIDGRSLALILRSKGSSAAPGSPLLRRVPECAPLLLSRYDLGSLTSCAPSRLIASQWGEGTRLLFASLTPPQGGGKQWASGLRLFCFFLFLMFLFLVFVARVKKRLPG